MKVHIIFKTFGGMDGNFLKGVNPKPNFICLQDQKLYKNKGANIRRYL
jgi:hypothetical protein